MKENNQLESEEMLEDLTEQISNNKNEMDGIEESLCDKKNNISNNNKNSSNKNTFNIELIEKLILDDETKQYDIIKNENIVIKKLDKDIETLWDKFEDLFKGELPFKKSCVAHDVVKYTLGDTKKVSEIYNWNAKTSFKEGIIILLNNV
jgi:hypothetical protein